MHTIAVVGVGTVGIALARALERQGHTVTFASRDTSSDRAIAAADAAPGVDVEPVDTAVGPADVVVLAVPGGAVPSAIAGLGDLSGKVVIDVTNTLGAPLPDDYASVTHQIAALAPGAAVAKAFNTIGIEHVLDPIIDGRALVLPVAGHDRARAVAAELAGAMGFDVVDLGDIDAAPQLEAFAQLWITMAFLRGYGRDFGFALVRGEQ